MPINFKQLVVLLVLMILFFGDTNKIIRTIKKNFVKLKNKIQEK